MSEQGTALIVFASVQSSVEGKSSPAAPVATDARPVRILLIHQAFASPSDGGGKRHYEFGRRVLSKGHSFIIVASDLSYPSGASLVDRRGLYVEQSMDGLPVLRALYCSFIWRVFSFPIFIGSSVFTALTSRPVDIVMDTSPPILQAFAAWAVAFLRRSPFLLEVRDLWPEFAIDLGVLQNSVLIWLSQALEHFLYARATEYLICRHIARLRIGLISNGVDPAMFNPASKGERVRHEWGLDGKFVVTDAGAIGIANDLATVIQATDRLRESTHFVLAIAGDGNERLNLEADATERGLRNVIFTVALSKTEVGEVMAGSDACTVILKDISMFRTSYPNKVCDYMAAGRPILLAINGVIRKVIKDSGSGLFVPPGDAAALAHAILNLTNNRPETQAMGLRGREFVAQHFNRDQQAAEFVSPIKRAVQDWRRERHSFYRHFGKRALDPDSHDPLIVALLPLLAAIMILVRRASRGPFF